MKNSIFVSLLIFAICAACSQDRETASGQKFTIIHKGDGHPIDSGKFLVLNFLFKDGKDSIWNDTRKNDYPLVMQKQGFLRPGDKVLEVIGMLTKGDSAIFKVPVKEVFAKSFRQQVPRNVDSTSYFSFYVGLKDALTSDEFNKFRTELVAKQNEKALKLQQNQLAKDTVIIDNYLNEKNIKAQKTLSGIRYVITKKGIGENVRDGQIASVNYAGYLLNGKYFDTSIESKAKENNIYQQGRPYAPYDVNVGRGGVIRGWEEVLKLMNKGSKMTAYIPSTLAYGSQRRDENVIENSILVFDMELVEVK